MWVFAFLRGFVKHPYHNTFFREEGLKMAFKGLQNDLKTCIIYNNTCSLQSSQSSAYYRI
jgi:hypothetical protein